jgi:hypothetical protein
MRKAFELGGPADQGERRPHLLEDPDPRVIELDLHQDHAVDQPLSDQFVQLGAVVADRPQHQVIILLARRVCRAGEELRGRETEAMIERRIGHRDDVRAPAGQRAGHHVAAVAELGHGLLDLLPGRRPDGLGVVQQEGHGRGRHARTVRDVSDGHHRIPSPLNS